MYTEVLQDSVIPLLESGRCTFASSCALTLSPAVMRHVIDNLDFFKARVVLRPQEISNSPEVVRRLGVVSMNTAIEVDLGGNVNSTHVMGKTMMNGIGGSGDFTRNAYLSMFSCPSTAKGGKISAIVPLASHMDHSEHSVQVIVTEQGVADLRGKDPHERARADHRQLRPPGLSRPAAPLPEADQGGPRAAVTVARPGHAPPVPAPRRHAPHRLGRVPVRSPRGVASSQIGFQSLQPGHAGDAGPGVSGRRS